MSASICYYNENDQRAAAWLRQLIAERMLPEGQVDERDIRDVVPSELSGYRQCHFFAGIGGWPYALRLAGWPDDRPVWTGSCPCQPFSQAGSRAGFADERHLWPAWFHLIEQCRPPVIYGEQVASKAALEWVDTVFDDLEGAGYACRAEDLCAAGVGAPHIRQRLFWMADAGRGIWSASQTTCVGGSVRFHAQSSGSMRRSRRLSRHQEKGQGSSCRGDANHAGGPWICATIT